MATSSGHMPYRMKGQTTCVHHKGRELDLYCEQCKELVCPKCLSSVHKGHVVCELSEITPQKEPVIKTFIDRTEKDDLVQVQKCIASTDTLLKDNASTFEKLSQNLKLETEKLKTQLDILTEQTLSLYHRLEEDNTRLIKKYKEDLEMYEKHLKQQVQECKVALQRGSHIEIYHTFCEIHSRTYSLPVKPELSTAEFTPNTNPQDCLKEALGKVITSGQAQTLTGKGRSVSSFDVQGQSRSQQQRPQTKVVEEWEPSCRIESICPTTDGQVWTKYLDTLTLLDRKGNFMQKVNHNVLVNDISLSPTTQTLWVCDNGNNISELVSGRLIQRFSTNEEPRCICITASNHVIVGMVNNVSKFTTEGKIVRTTMATVTGKPLVFSAWRIAECPVSQNVAIADINMETDGGDGKGRIVVMDTDFNELFVYRGDIPSTYQPTPQTGGAPLDPSGGVVYDSVGKLIIGDYNNCRVLLISEGGEFLRVIHKDKDFVRNLGIDSEGVLWSTFGTLLGTKFGTTRVKLFQYMSE